MFTVFAATIFATHVALVPDPCRFPGCGDTTVVTWQDSALTLAWVRQIAAAKQALFKTGNF